MGPKNTSENQSKDPAGYKPSSTEEGQRISSKEGASMWSKIWEVLKTGVHSIWIIVMVVGGILAFVFSLFLL